MQQTRRLRLCAVAVCLFALVGSSHQLCVSNWADPSSVLTLRSNKYEASVSGASLRLYGVRASGVVYREEFVELSVVRILSTIRGASSSGQAPELSRLSMTTLSFDPHEINFLQCVDCFCNAQ